MPNAKRAQSMLSTTGLGKAPARGRATRPWQRGGKPVGVRQAALDRKAAELSLKYFRRGSALPRRTSHLASADASPRPFAVKADVMYERACLQILWDGNALSIFGGRGYTWPVSSGGVESDFLPPAMGSPKSVTSAPLANAPVVVGLALLKSASRPIDLLLFLDSRSRRLGAVHVRGFSEAAISDVARKAGVELSVYELPARFGRSGRSRQAAVTAMFPRSVLYR
ncbi:hypothetical protein ABH926_003577 [Catenulispora sp. GP43]|uniref:hypothetical protein n=1 Tax=Catenulispora sp. GP43 TaxID=3156263 RepID=UPI0035143473